MNLCFFNRSYWPDQAATGQLLTELAEDLVAQHGCQVTVVAGRPLHAAAVAENRRVVAREIRNGVTILRANGTAFGRRRFAGRASNYLSYTASALVASRLIGRPDVVVALTDPPIIGRVALAAARRTAARFVFLCEDVFPEVAALLEDFHNGIVNRALDRINRQLLGEADAIVALGERMRERLVEEKGADPARIEVIHNWADCEAIRPGPKDNAFRREHGLTDRFVLMHSGNVGLSQSLDVLIEAAAALRSRDRLSIVIVGDGAKRVALKEAADRLRLTNVLFVPYQAKETVSLSFAAADAFLVSLKPGIEGYIVPSKLYGILAAGRPYVAAVDPSCEVARLALAHGCGVLASPGDPGALALAITTLYDDRALAVEMGRRARELAWRFDRRRAVDAYHQLFARVAGVASVSTEAPSKRIPGAIAAVGN